MKFYLSSYKLGDKPEQFATLFSGNKKVGYIPNALDYPIVDFERKAKHIEKDMNSLREIGLNPSLLDLRDFFGNRKSLEREMKRAAKDMNFELAARIRDRIKKYRK